MDGYRTHATPLRIPPTSPHPSATRGDAVRSGAVCLGASYVHDMAKARKGKEKEKSNNVRTDSKDGKRLLSAYELGQRLAKKCQEGSLDEAIDMLKNMPLDAQNTANWNSLMKQAGNVGRYQLAYQLYIEASP